RSLSTNFILSSLFINRLRDLATLYFSTTLYIYIYIYIYIYSTYTIQSDFITTLYLLYYSD
ncbi:MAG: hypothetical protein MCS20_01635, partial [Candidatus Phytoplasma mali]|nr:hypothetical protein [Candidatus Phytoplasma australiense]MBZ7920101.1 hypothetical protein [Candidatus Karelsulcia muelleri]MCG7202095.1 hypothetical protein [Candidatus Phytoplasma mali]MCZ8632511.1 hypothetical protein [Spiroplasma sp. Tabriz.8]